MLGLEIAGLGLSAASAGANALFGARERARQRRILREQEQDNQRWYNRRYSEVGTERADAKAALARMREAQSQRVANASGRAAVMGASGAAVAQEKQAANEALGNVVTNINAQADKRKDAIESQYMQTKNNIQAARNNMSAQTQANLANAATGAMAVGASMMGTVGSGTSKTAAVPGELDPKLLGADPNKLTNAL